MERWAWDASDVHARRVHHKRWSIDRFGGLMVGVPGIALVIRRVVGVCVGLAWPALFRLVMSEEIAGWRRWWMACPRISSVPAKAGELIRYCELPIVAGHPLMMLLLR